MTGGREGDGAGSRRLGPMDAAVLAGIIAAVFLLYGRALGFWWTADDPAILRHVYLYRPTQYLFVPAVYQDISGLFFFPGLILSFEVDLDLFGFRPIAFYLHQLAAVAAGAVLLYALMRRWNGRPASFVAALLFLVGPSLAEVAPQLGVRHYVDGLVLALLSTLCFLRSLESRTWLWSAAGGILFLGAMTCKEIYAPLILLLVALPEGRLVDRLRKAVPLLLAVAVYAVWRQAMLGGYVGGYSGAALGVSDVPHLARSLLAQTGGALFGARTPAGAGLAWILALGFLIPAARRGRPLLFALWCAALVLAPLIPVGDYFQARYGLVPWTAAAAGAGWAVNEWARRRGGVVAGAALLLVATALVLPVNRARWTEVVRRSTRSRAEAMFFLHESGPGDVLRLPVEAGSFYTWLGWLRSEALHRGRPGRAVLDDLFFCRVDDPTKKVYGFSEGSGHVEPVVGGAPAVCRDYRRRIREDAPLSLRISGDRGVFSWEFGPPVAGSWAVLIGDDLIRYDLPRLGRQKGAILPDGTTITLRYESPEGWIAFSPALPLKLVAGGALIEWSR